MTTKKTLSILIVDDEPGVRELVKRCLDDASISLAEAGSGQEALEQAAKSQALQLLITDQRMPEMEGHELARQLRAKHPDLKVLYLTSDPDYLFDAKQHLWDLEAYLSKPFTREGLREAVAHLTYGRMTL